MKYQDSSFNGLKVTVGTKSVTHAAITFSVSKVHMICLFCFVLIVV